MTTILHRRGTASDWVKVNPVLAVSEIGYETDTGKFKFGDGTRVWTVLPYVTSPAAVGPVHLYLDQLVDVIAPQDTPAANLLGTTGVGAWEPIPYAYLKQEIVEPIQNEIGDPSLLTSMHPSSDLVHWLTWLEARLRVVEAAGSDPGSTGFPDPEGSLEVDNYGGGFARVRDTGGVLADGQVHVVNMILATTPGPGGAVYDPVAGVPASTQPTWFDRNGSLGYVKGSTGTNVNQTTLRNWVKYSDPATPNHYIQWVHLTDAADDATKPLLVVDRVATVT